MPYVYVKRAIRYLCQLGLGVMFADACEKAMKYTRHIAVSTRTYDGKIATNIAAMIIINPEGWAITAGHVFDSFVKFQEDAKKLNEIRELNASRSQTAGAQEIKPDNDLLTNHSFWLGWDGVMMSNVFVNRQADIAVMKLEGFKSSWVSEYPVFADPNHMRIGQSLCRGGYPFVKVIPKFLEDKNAFQIPSIDSDQIFYPIDGMLTHIENRGKTADGSCVMKYIETSSPGFKGQSGGPIFDAEGNIYGMQIRTYPRELGIHPTAELDGQTFIENQFVNVGVGLHASTIMELLDFRHVSYSCVGDEFRIIS